MAPAERVPGRRHLDLGAEGEARTASWYREHGYTVLDRNWRCPQGEIDLVVQRGEVLVVCEVKTRSSTRFGSPAEAVDARKQQRLRRLAMLWLRAHPARGRRRLRFDVAEVLPSGINVIEQAF